MSRTLRRGDTGTDVRNLQELLNFHGCNLVPDGKFGSLTLAEVLKLQKAAGTDQDGAVGPRTKLALFPSLVTDAAYYLSTAGHNLTALFTSAMTQSAFAAQALPKLQTASTSVTTAPTPAAPTPAPVAPTPTPAQPTPPPRFNFQNLIVQGGNSFAWNPYAPSPLVVAATGTFVIRWSDVGWSGLKLSGQGQFSVNGLNSPNGKWTGQGAIQLQPTAPWLDKNLKFFDERVDLTSIFVAGFIQKNQNSSALQSGFGLGIQPSLALIKGTGDDPIVTFSLNAQVVKAWDVRSGAGQPVSPQFAAALGIDIWQLFHQK